MSESINLGIDMDNTIIKGDFGTRSMCISGDESRWFIHADAVDVLPKLFNMGFKMHVITGRSDNDYNRVKKILTAVESRLNIKFESFTLTNNNKKGKYAKEKKCKYMIDDYEVYLEDCAENNVTPILYSKNFYGNGAYNWHQIYDMLTEK